MAANKDSGHKVPEKNQIRWRVSAKELLALPGKKALDVILDAPMPAHLVQSLAEEDLFWLVKDIGPEDALPILSLASNEQWQYLLDLELWQDDRLHVDSVNRWLSLLLNADPERFLIWGLREHVELIELNLFRNIEVRIRQEDESASDFDDTYFTLDGAFYISINQGKYHQSIRQFLERLQSHDRDKFNGILLEIAGVLPAETEEEIYRLRNIRLAEKGFLPFDEALGIYQHLGSQSIVETESDMQNVLEEPKPAEHLPVSASLLVKGQDLFSMSLECIEESHILERLQVELAAVCNQVVSADRRRVQDKEDLAAVVRKVCGYLSLGLEKATEGDRHKAAIMLQKYPLHQIFRAGYGTALELQWEAKKWLHKSWFATAPFDLGFWEDQWEGLLEGILKKRPIFHTGYTPSSKGEPFREFETAEDLTRCHEALDQIVALDNLLNLLFGKTPFAESIEAHHAVTYKSLLLTCWARHELGLSEDMEPLQAEHLRSFFVRLWSKGERPPLRISDDMKQAFLDWLAERSGPAAPGIVEQLGPTLQRLLAEIEKDYGSVSLEDLDPRHVKHLLITP
jgi:hypothetical protein